MKIRINSIMAHPRFGACEPGTVLDLSEEDAQPLLEAGVADRVEPVRSATRMETARMDQPETAMQPPARSRPVSGR